MVTFSKVAPAQFDMYLGSNCRSAKRGCPNAVLRPGTLDAAGSILQPVLEALSGVHPNSYLY